MKNNISIRMTDITKLETDAIVNAANDGLRPGGGVCGAIFQKAGYDKLYKACSAIGRCKIGGAVITPGFQLKAKYIIHAVGPIWRDGAHKEPEQLYSAYKQSLQRAKEKQCHSIGFPLISSGIFGYPKELAWKTAITSCNDFMVENPDYPIEIVFAVLNDELKSIGETVMKDVLGE